MTVSLVVEGNRGETLAGAAARRLREQLAGRQISQKTLALRMGVSSMWLNRRYKGQTALSLEDLDLIESSTGISAAYLVTGVNAENRHPDHPNGETCLRCTPRDLNPEPTGYGSNVIALNPLTTVFDSGASSEITAEVLAFPALKNKPEVDAK